MLVIVLTGLYTMLGGMRAVAYNDAVQVFVLILGSASLTVYGLIKLGGWQELRHLCGSDMFNLWKPLIPAGMEGTWAPVKEADPIAWYFNTNYPWLGMAICAPVIGLWYWCTDQYIVQRALGAPNESIARRGSIFAAFLKLFPGLPLHHPGPDLLRPGQKWQGARNWPRCSVPTAGRAGDGPESLPEPGAIPTAAGFARAGGGGAALRADGFAGGGV